MIRVGFKIQRLVLYYIRLGKVRLRRSDDPHSVPTILRTIGRLIRVGLKIPRLVLYYVRLG